MVEAAVFRAAEAAVFRAAEAAFQAAEADTIEIHRTAVARSVSVVDEVAVVAEVRSAVAGVVAISRRNPTPPASVIDGIFGPSN